ncbi:MAG: DUF3769 domain-containing protein [Elainella sp. Prado103]|jgi:hypothetical protein|nr:DUF3769 domain-containing protein [Elainella sp. Prado103]
MPYPVLPPSPPPVIAVAPSEEGVHAAFPEIIPPPEDSIAATDPSIDAATDESADALAEHPTAIADEPIEPDRSEIQSTTELADRSPEWVESVEPELIESESVEPESVESGSVEPESVESGSVEPELIESESVEPESVESGSAAFELIESELIESGSIESESVERSNAWIDQPSDPTLQPVPETPSDLEVADSTAAALLGEPLSIRESWGLRDRPTGLQPHPVTVHPAAESTAPSLRGASERSAGNGDANPGDDQATDSTDAALQSVFWIGLPELDRLIEQQSATTTGLIDRRDSIRLDLPTTESTTESIEPNPDPELPEVEAPEAEPGLGEGQLSQPELEDPTRGEVLVIPTTPPTETAPSTPPSAAPATPPNAPVLPIDPVQQGEVLEVTADRQELDERRQVFRADGDVVVRFRQAVLSGDRVRVNLPNRVAVAEGDALLTRGDQVLGGDRFEYSFGLNQGNIQGARGQLLIPATERDFNTDPLTDFPAPGLQRPVTERVSDAQPLQVTGGLPGLVFGVGDNRAQDGPGINRLRFEAERVNFDGGNLVGQNVRITNDPFSPPELELRSSHVTYTRLSPFTAEIRARNPRLVFDQGFSLPLLVNRIVLDQRQRDSGLLTFGFDERDRDGFFIERTFNLYSSPQVAFSLTPQILVQRAIEDGSFPSADQFGLIANADFTFTPTTTGRAVASFSSLDTSEIEDNLRASFRAQQLVLGHTVSAEYSYRDRLFNGSLGFQDIQSSLGLVVSSPTYTLGDSLITLRYQAGVQYVNAQTDQIDLYNFLDPDRDRSCIKPEDRDSSGNGCVDLTRYQAAATLGRFFLLWSGTALPPTPTEGLRYTPTPIVPYLGVYLEARGVYSGYSNGDHQATLRGGVSLLGQFGHFSRPFLDYTAFNVGYFNTLQDGESPFLFDRVADDEFVILGLTQQIYGPFRAGVQFAYNLRNNDEIDTTYSLEYSRRTYSISATYSTGRESGALTLRLYDFNWTGDPGPFSGLGSSTVDGGVVQDAF